MLIFLNPCISVPTIFKKIKKSAFSGSGEAVFQKSHYTPHGFGVRYLENSLIQRNACK